MKNQEGRFLILVVIGGLILLLVGGTMVFSIRSDNPNAPTPLTEALPGPDDAPVDVASRAVGFLNTLLIVSGIFILLLGVGVGVLFLASKRRPRDEGWKRLDRF